MRLFLENQFPDIRNRSQGVDWETDYMTNWLIQDHRSLSRDHCEVFSNLRENEERISQEEAMKRQDI